MNFDKLADGATTKALGLLPVEGFWLAVIFIVLALALVVFLLKSMSDRKVLDLPPVNGATFALLIIAILSVVGGTLILFY